MTAAGVASLGGGMGRNMMAALKLIVMVATLFLAALGVLYVLELFNDAQLRDLVEKTLKIVGIVIVASIVFVLLYGNRHQQ